MTAAATQQLHERQVCNIMDFFLKLSTWLGDCPRALFGSFGVFAPKYASHAQSNAPSAVSIHLQLFVVTDLRFAFTVWLSSFETATVFVWPGSSRIINKLSVFV
jgi:hypothetical protein